MMQSAWHRVVRSGIESVVWLAYGRNSPTPLRPCRLIDIDPGRVRAKPTNKPDGVLPIGTAVVGGDWDRERTPIETDPVYEAFTARFIDGKRWSETGYIEFLRTNISEHASDTDERILARCRFLDELYESIEEDGYLSQRELEAKANVSGVYGGFTVLPPEFREIAVSVGRNGTLLWHTGMHRLVIAQLLNVDSVPVRVAVRHARWQERRDRLSDGGGHRVSRRAVER